MSVFGSRDEDPLLQDDPLAPSADEDAEDDVRDDTSEGSSPEKKSASPDPAGDGHLSTATTDRADDSVFQATTLNEKSTDPDHACHDGSEEPRVIVRAVDEAAEGRLPVLNAALAQGCSLKRVEVRERDSTTEDVDAEEGSSSGASVVLAFVLARGEFK